MPGSEVIGLGALGLSRQRAGRDARDAALLGAGTPSGSFAEDLESERRTRAFMVENAPSNLPYLALASFFDVSERNSFLVAALLTCGQRHEFSTLRGSSIGDLASMGKFYVAFADSREAKRAVEKVQRLQPTWRVGLLTAREYVQHTEPALLPQTSDFEGQLLATVFYDSRNPRLNRLSAAQTLQTLLVTFGDVKTFLPLPATQANVSDFHIEFFNTRDADNAMISLNNAPANVV